MASSRIKVIFVDHTFSFLSTPPYMLLCSKQLLFGEEKQRRGEMSQATAAATASLAACEQSFTRRAAELTAELAQGHVYAEFLS